MSHDTSVSGYIIVRFFLTVWGAFFLPFFFFLNKLHFLVLFFITQTTLMIIKTHQASTGTDIKRLTQHY